MKIDPEGQRYGPWGGIYNMESRFADQEEMMLSDELIPLYPFCNILIFSESDFWLLNLARSFLPFANIL